MSDDEEIWTTDQVEEFLDHAEHRVRLWALNWLGERLDEEKLESIAIDVLGDEEPKVAYRAFDLLERVATGDRSEAVEQFLERSDIGGGAEENVLAFLASFGDASAQRKMFERVGQGAQLRWGSWVDRAPDSLAEAAEAYFSDRELPVDHGFFQALIRTGDPSIVPMIFDAAIDLDDPAKRGEIFDALLRQGGGALPRFPTPESLTWYGSEEDDEATTLPFVVPYDEMSARSQKLKRELQQRNFGDFLEGVVSVFELAVEHGFDEFDSPESQLSRAMAEILRERGAEIEPARMQVRLAYGTLLAVTQSVGVEMLLEEESDFETLLALRDNALGADKFRLARLVQSTWRESEGNTDAREAQENALREWLGDYVNTEHRLDKLDLAMTLPGVQIADDAEELVGEIEGEDSDFVRRDPVAAGVVADLLVREPGVLRSVAGGALTGEGLPFDIVVDALGRCNARWAGQLIGERIDEILSQEDGYRIWETISDLGDPELLELAVREWHPDQVDIARCAHLLANLGERTDELPDELLGELDEVERESSEVSARLQSIADEGGSFLDYIDEEPLPLRLRCEECGRTYRYLFERVFIDMDELMELGNSEEIAESFDRLLEFDRPVECHHCGEAESFELTDTSRMILMMSLRELLASNSPSKMQGGRIVPKFSSAAGAPQGARQTEADGSTEAGAETYIKRGSEPGRNDPCPCGSGLKYKQCCMRA